MSPKFFIDRPIFACVISALILLVGIIGLAGLPVEQFPDMAPPTINVITTYTGANAETVQKSVVTPLEESINGVEDMIYMTSSATNTGNVTITVYFKPGTDPDMAQVNVQNRVSSALGLLPSEVTKVGVNTMKRQNGTLKVISLYSEDDAYDNNFLDNYMKINIIPRLARISGVGDCMMLGSDYSMRIWLNPEIMAQYGLTPMDVSAALGEQNLESPTGTLGQDSKNTFQYSLKYRGRYESVEEFEEIVIKAMPDGSILRLKDVAKVELGALTYSYRTAFNGHPGTVCMIAQQAGSNANEIIKAIDKEVEEMSAELPKGIKIADLVNTNDFLEASIDNVIQTLIEAILLVIIVVYLFLQSMRSTFIPTLSIIVSLIGTFAFLYVAGFSLNLLTLFALVLVIGTVVDDAIVVVEAVQAKFDEGVRSPYVAAVKGMREITAPLITTTIVFMSVFIPVCFMGGTTGTFYTQFGLTMAVAVAISAVNALTLSPALCALIMTPHAEVANGGKLSFSSRFHKAFDASFNSLVGKYKYAVVFFIRRHWLVYSLLAIAIAGLFYMLRTTKTGLVPDEDTGAVYVNVVTSPGSSMEETDRIMQTVAKCIEEVPQVQSFGCVSGYGMLGGMGATNGIAFIRLKPWDERSDKENQMKAVVARISAKVSAIKNASIMVLGQPVITGYGSSNSIEMHVQDRKGGTIDELQNQTRNMIGQLSARPEIAMAYTSFATRFPQYRVEVDAARCKLNGVSPSDVLGVLSGYVGGIYSSNINLFSKLYRVMVQAAPQYRLDKEALNNIFVRTSSGEMSPINQYLTLTKVYGSESLSRFNMFPSISVNVMPAEGYSTGQALAAIGEVAASVLPTGYGYEFGGMSREEAASGTDTVVIFIICLLLVYMVLCALYESLFIPFAVILSVPFGLAGSFLFARIFGIDNNIYMQTGLIMLIGLLAKTAILLTEYAAERRKQGMSLGRAAVEAAKVRLRPILMTALTMIFGLLPMTVASGVGANGSRSLAIGTVGGMLVGTVALLFILPCLFILFQHIQERVMPGKNRNNETIID